MGAMPHLLTQQLSPAWSVSAPPPGPTLHGPIDSLSVLPASRDTFLRELRTLGRLPIAPPVGIDDWAPSHADTAMELSWWISRDAV